MNKYKIVILVLFMLGSLNAQMTWTQVAIPGWSSRFCHSSAVYDNKIWVIGGDATGGVKNDVWYSPDGTSWTLATSAAQWPIRYAHSSVVFDNKLWVLGGANASSRRNDVWYTINGFTWIQATDTAEWSARYAHKSVVFDNKMWVIGGYSYGGRNDVWYSSDGINWTQATASANWSARYGHTSVVFDNKMWVIGGAASNYTRDVWYSTDGVSWTQAIATAPWTGRDFHASVVFDNKIWLMGGYDGGRRDDVWYSTGLVGIEDNRQPLFANPTLLNAEPNPAKSLSVIRYALPVEGKASLQIYDISGKSVKTLVNEFKRSGVYSVKWNGKDEHDQRVAEGVYFYTLETREQKFTKKLILTR